MLISTRLLYLPGYCVLMMPFKESNRYPGLSLCKVLLKQRREEQMIFLCLSRVNRIFQFKFQLEYDQIVNWYYNYTQYIDGEDR